MIRELKTSAGVLVALACLSHTQSVTAQEAPFIFELTPFAGYRFGGAFEEEDTDRTFDLDESNAHGIILNIREGPNTQWEVLYARQSAGVDVEPPLANGPAPDLDVEYLHFGGTVLSRGENTRGFLAATIGLTRFDPQPGGSGAETNFSGSIGGGVQFRASRRLGVRLEGRVVTTFVSSDSDLFCSIGGASSVCAVRVEGSTLTQWELRAGLVFRFSPPSN